MYTNVNNTSAKNVSLSTTFETGAVDVSQFINGSFQANFNYTTGNSAGTCKVQISNDGVNFADYANSSLAFNSTNATNPIIWIFSVFAVKYIKLVFTNVSGAGGLVSVQQQLVRPSAK